MVRRPPTAFKEDGQYAIAIVMLDAGVQVTGRLANPAEVIQPDARVGVTGLHRGVAVFEAAAS